jgi:hypothetical protein
LEERGSRIRQSYLFSQLFNIPCTRKNVVYEMLGV